MRIVEATETEAGRIEVTGQEIAAFVRGGIQSGYLANPRTWGTGAGNCVVQQFLVAKTGDETWRVGAAHAWRDQTYDLPEAITDQILNFLRLAHHSPTNEEVAKCFDSVGTTSN